MDINITTFLYIFLHICPLILVSFFTISSIFNKDIKGMVYLIGLLFSIGFFIFIDTPINWILDKINNYFNRNTDHNSESICNILSFGNNDLTNFSIGQMIIGFSFFYLLSTMLYVDANTNDSDIVGANWPTITFFTLLIMSELLVNTNIKKKHFFSLIALIGVILLSTYFTEFFTPIIDAIKTYWIILIVLVPILGIQMYQYIDISKIKKYFSNDEAIDPEEKESPYCYDWLASLFTYAIAGGFGALYAFIIYLFKTPDLQYFARYKNNEKCDKVGKKTFACKVFKGGERIQ